MKKFRMLLPMLAFVFAVAGAIAGDFLPGVAAYYKIDSTTCSTVQVTEQDNCQTNLSQLRPQCTILIDNQHKPAFAQSNCTDPLRIPAE